VKGGHRKVVLNSVGSRLRLSHALRHRLRRYLAACLILIHLVATVRAHLIRKSNAMAMSRLQSAREGGALHFQVWLLRVECTRMQEDEFKWIYESPCDSRMNVPARKVI
jgi:hypothetical protein